MTVLGGQRAGVSQGPAAGSHLDAGGKWCCGDTGSHLGSPQSEFWTLLGGRLGSGLEQHPFLWPQHANEVLMRSEPPGLFWILPSRSTSSRDPASLDWREGLTPGWCSGPPSPPCAPAVSTLPARLPPQANSTMGALSSWERGGSGSGPPNHTFWGSASKTVKQKHSPKGRGGWHRAFGGVLPGDN